MVTRTSKAKAKATVTDVPFVETAQPEMAMPSFFERLQAELGVTAIGWKRCLIGAVASLLVTCGLGYVAGTLVAYMAIGSLLFTGSAFIASCLYVIGMILTFYAGYRIGPIAYLNIIDKTVDAKFASARDWVTGLFGSAPKAA